MNTSKQKCGIDYQFFPIVPIRGFLVVIDVQVFKCNFTMLISSSVLPLILFNICRNLLRLTTTTTQQSSVEMNQSNMATLIYNKTGIGIRL